MTEHRIGTQEEWQAERNELLKEEKQLTRRGDELARKRRELPWVPVAVYIISKMANDAFKALAHPLRRDIVERLSGGVATVGEVTRDFGVSKPTISRHLKMLEEAGVVSRAIDGRTHRLALRPEALAEASDWIESQRDRWERLFDVVGDYLEERKERR